MRASARFTKSEETCNANGEIQIRPIMSIIQTSSNRSGFVLEVLSSHDRFSAWTFRTKRCDERQTEGVAISRQEHSNRADQAPHLLNRKQIRKQIIARAPEQLHT